MYISKKEKRNKPHKTRIYQLRCRIKNCNQKVTGYCVQCSHNSYCYAIHKPFTKGYEDCWKSHIKLCNSNK